MTEWKKADRALDLYKLQKEAREWGIIAPRMVSVAAAVNYLLNAARPLGEPPVPCKTSLRSAADKAVAKRWKKYRKLARRRGSSSDHCASPSIVPSASERQKREPLQPVQAMTDPSRRCGAGRSIQRPRGEVRGSPPSASERDLAPLDTPRLLPRDQPESARPDAACFLRLLTTGQWIFVCNFIHTWELVYGLRHREHEAS